MSGLPRGAEAQSAGDVYQQLSRLMERCRRKQQKAEFLVMAQEHLNEEKEYEGAPTEARRCVAAKLLLQLVTKRRMEAARDEEGRLCTGANHIGKELSTH